MTARVFRFNKLWQPARGSSTCDPPVAPWWRSTASAARERRHRRRRRSRRAAGPRRAARWLVVRGLPWAAVGHVRLVGMCRWRMPAAASGRGCRHADGRCRTRSGGDGSRPRSRADRLRGACGARSSASVPSPDVRVSEIRYRVPHMWLGGFSV